VLEGVAGGAEGQAVRVRAPQQSGIREDGLPVDSWLLTPGWMTGRSLIRAPDDAHDAEARPPPRQGPVALLAPGRAAGLPVARPAATPHHPLFSLRRWFPIVGFPVVVGAPLADVAVHVVQAPGIGRVLADDFRPAEVVATPRRPVGERPIEIGLLRGQHVSK